MSNAKVEAAMPKALTRAEVARHNTREDLWLVIGDTIYDMTSFLQKHPGGLTPMRYAGIDATSVFSRIHAADVLEKYKHLAVGVLAVNKERSRDIARRMTPAGSTKGGLHDVAADPDGYDGRLGGEPGREFGDRMALEGETSHIPLILAPMYGAIHAWAVFTQWATGCSVWTIWAYYAAGMVACNAWHLLAHSGRFHSWCKRVGLGYLAELHEMHMEHHLERFPPSNFYGTTQLFAKMYPNGKPTIWTLLDVTRTTNIGDGTTLSKELNKHSRPHSPLAHEWPLLAQILVILVVARFACGQTWGTTACAFVLFAVQVSVETALHMSYHVRDFHLERYGWYRELRALHYLHHLGDMKSNLLMVNTGLNQVFHSLALTRADTRAGLTDGSTRAVVRGKRDADRSAGISVTGVVSAAMNSGRLDGTGARHAAGF